MSYSLLSSCFCFVMRRRPPRSRPYPTLFPYTALFRSQFNDIFAISPHAVKKQARVFKSVLKLDKNFHIYIHGDRSLIERGTEKDGRKFYKIYYREEF